MSDVQLRPLRIVRARSSVELMLPASLEAPLRVPPREIQLWNCGDNATDYGAHRWTERSVALVAGEYARRGNPFQIDIEHNLAESRERPALDVLPPTGGYCALEIRNGAPWLVFDWSAVAREQIATGQRLFLSPEYYTDESTGEIVAVTRVSLVGSPGTHFARRLASCDRGALKQRLATRAERQPMDLQMILAVIRAALANDDPEVMRASLTSLVSELAKTGGDDVAAPVETEGEPEPPPTMAAEGADGEPVKATEEEKKVEAAKLATAKLAAAKLTQARKTDVAITAARAIQDAHRDFVLEKEGARLPAPLRAWCASQPLAIVQGLLSAMPAPVAAPAHVTATRGPEPKPAERVSATPKEDLALMDRVMLGRRDEPVVKREGHRMTFAPMTAQEATRHLAAQAAKKAGN